MRRGESVLSPDKILRKLRGKDGEGQTMSHEEIMSDMQSPNENNRLDLVNVVRCKDCALNRVCRFGQYLGQDGYCSRGERRDG